MQGRSWRSGIAARQISEIPSTILSFLLLFTLTNAAAPNAAVDLAGNKQSHLPEFILPFSSSSRAYLTSAACTETLNAKSSSCYHKGPLLTVTIKTSAWKALHASTSSKIHEIKAMKLSVQKCSSSSWAIRHIGFFQARDAFFGTGFGLLLLLPGSKNQCTSTTLLIKKPQNYK